MSNVFKKTDEYERWTPFSATTFQILSILKRLVLFPKVRGESEPSIFIYLDQTLNDCRVCIFSLTQAVSTLHSFFACKTADPVIFYGSVKVRQERGALENRGEKSWSDFSKIIPKLAWFNFSTPTWAHGIKSIVIVTHPQDHKLTRQTTRRATPMRKLRGLGTVFWPQSGGGMHFGLYHSIVSEFLNSIRI